MTNRHSFKVQFTDEAEVYGPTALANGLIAQNFAASNIVITNYSTSTITIGLADTAIAEWEGAPLAGGDGVSPGGSLLLDLKANNASTGRIRARVHGGGTGYLSFLVI